MTLANSPVNLDHAGIGQEGAGAFAIERAELVHVLKDRPELQPVARHQPHSPLHCLQAAEGGELVDDDDQARRGLDLAAALQLDEVLGLEARQQVLSVVQLRRQRRERSPHEVRRQVGDHADGVGEVDAVPEGRPALVVDEDERDILGAVGAGQRDESANGLAWFSLDVEKPDLFAAREERLRKTGASVVAIANGIEAVDPWGTRLRLIKL